MVTIKLRSDEKGNNFMKKVIIIVGAFGSGKSEYSANLTYQNKISTIIDMDIMNPYFRTRELTEKFFKQGIEVVAPEGAFRHTELPMLSPKIQARLKDTTKEIVIDVGGDSTGMKVLGRYKSILNQRGYDLRMVINIKRPQTSTKTEILKSIAEFEAVSGMKITSLVSNSNLMELTDIELITQGVEIIDEVAKEKEINFQEFCVLKSNARGIPAKINGKKMFVMDYFFSKPWER